jgi:ABC-2 type transport system permease protein
MAARSQLAYRGSFLLGQFAVLFQLLAMLSVWRVLLASGAGIAGYTWPQMKAYLLIAFATGVALTSNGDDRMAWRIRDGAVAVDLTKPVDYQRARLAEVLGATGLELAMVMVVVGVVLGLTGPATMPDGTQTLLFAASLLAVVPVKFGVLFLTGTLCFWTQNFFGVTLARAAIVGLFSGALVPLDLLPSGVRLVAMVLPFSGITATPAAIFLGSARGGGAFALLAAQLGWGLVLWLGGRALWRVGIRQLTVHGG